jgi:hypothetical protein
MSKQNFSAYPIENNTDFLESITPGYGLTKKELCAFMAMQGMLSNIAFQNFDTKVIVNQSIVISNEMCKQLGIGHE